MHCGEAPFAASLQGPPAGLVVVALLRDRCAVRFTVRDDPARPVAGSVPRRLPLPPAPDFIPHRLDLCFPLCAVGAHTGNVVLVDVRTGYGAAIWVCGWGRVRKV